VTMGRGSFQKARGLPLSMNDGSRKMFRRLRPSRNLAGNRSHTERAKYAADVDVIQLVRSQTEVSRWCQTTTRKSWIARQFVRCSAACNAVLYES
jgi:hypothetical protein